MAELFANTGHLFDDVINIADHFHHADVVFVDSLVELFLRFMCAHVVAGYYQQDSTLWSSERGVTVLNRFSGETSSFTFSSTHDNDYVLGAELLSEFLNPPLVLQVHGASCRSDEALSRRKYDFAASRLNAGRNCLAGHAITVANNDDFFAG